MHRLVSSLLSLVFAVSALDAGAARAALPLDINEIIAPEPLTGRIPSSITWAPDGSRFLYALPTDRPDALDTRVYDVRKRTSRIFFAASPNGKGSRPAPDFVWSPDSRRLAYLDGGDLYVINADGSARRKLATDVDDPQWSPDAQRIACVHAGDLYAVTLSGKVTRYTHDGSGDVVNGDPDWVYSEELDMHHAYAWSPDGARIAYLHFDQRPIQPFPIVDFLDPNNTVAQQRYPLAGQANSIVSLRVASADGKATQLYSTAPRDEYLASVGWSADGRVVATILDRAQTHLRIAAFSGTAATTLLRETDPRWVDFHGAPLFLRDRRSMLFLSDREGSTNVYVADLRTGAQRRLTREGTALDIAAVDERRRIVYVTSAYPTRRDQTVLAIPLRGGENVPLEDTDGSHRFTFNANGDHYVRVDSTFTTPPVYAVGSPREQMTVPFAAAKPMPAAGLGKTTLFQIPSAFGKLDAWMIVPPDFDPAKRYPVITYVYGGPASPTTTNAWGERRYLYHQMLAQHGFIVFSVDGPGSQIDSAAAVRSMYHKLGPTALQGQLAGVDYLKTLPYVDPKRIGIWGWSFGGTMTEYALTHAPGVWKAGAAVAPVTDWRYYDTIYTERYMGKPQQFPDAYAASSVIGGVDEMQGALLVSHGTADDNVHMANTIAFLQACILAGKQVDFMPYPRKTHSISGVPQQRHLFEHMLEFWEAHL